MIETTTRQRLYVSTEGDAGPYIMVPEAQLAQVLTLLEQAKVPHWVDEEAISLDGKPEIAVVNLGRGIDPQAVQGLLDSFR